MIELTQAQELAAQWLSSRNGILLATPGAGKTRTVLRMLEMTGERALIVAPASVARRVWSDEAAKVTSGIRIVPLTGSEPQRAKLLWELIREDHVVISYESLPWLARQVDLNVLADVIVFDEVSRMRNPKGARTKLVKNQVKAIPHRIGLTGTPAANHLHHLYGQLQITAGLDMIREQWLARYFTSRQIRVGRADFRQNILAWDTNEHTLEKIKPLLDQHTHTMVADRMADGIRTIDHWVQVPKTCRNVESTSTVVSQQYAQGRLYQNAAAREELRHEHDVESLHNAKQNALVTLLEEMQGEPVLIFYAFRHDLTQIKSAASTAGVTKARYPTDVRALAELVPSWNNRELEVLCVHPGSAGHGLNLQAGGHQIVWFGLPWDAELYEQGVRRLLRQGQIHTVMNHRILAEDTVDAKMIAQLTFKSKAAAPVMGEHVNARL